MRQLIPACFCLLSLTLLFASHAWARLGVEPRLAVREEYDDNIFLASFDEESDFITTVNPGMALRWETRRFSLVLDYGFEFLFFRDHPEFDATSVRDTQRARAEAEIFPEKSFSVRILDEYRRVSIDRRRPTVETNLIVNKINENHFLLGPRYRLGRLPALQATLGYQFDKFAYDSPEGDDHTSHAFTLELAREFSPRWVLTLSGAQRFHYAEINDDFRRQDLVAGFTFKAGPQLTLRGDGGVSRIEFRDGDAETSAIWSAGADLRATPRLSFGLAYSENFTVLVDDGLAKTRTARGTVGYAGKIRTDFSVFAQDEDFRSVDREDRSAGGALALRIPVGERLDLRLHGSLAYLEFLPEDEDVRRTSAGAALEYRLGIFTVSLGYDHHVSRSNLPGTALDNNEYRNNIVFLAAAVRFERSLTGYQEGQNAEERLPLTAY
ncbi:MAG TPA: TIGR03016 family PEP-CTERM system-associated outer membrane protein [Desulfuromonadales bacterium]|nr:TIGR03016 family PEP-CTERM system-associated outer membrane protein [Desulfuromonadales bacterium]